ncbi:MAG: hypothetical protein JSU94_12645 [Phycisphaerales bacterium]|nr:MAG: hypothetical protein JSU94_12645 [Phycisphaerales bacterium]
MAGHSGKGDKDWSRDLERELRQIEQPEVPPEVEQRLLSVVSARRRKPVRFLRLYGNRRVAAVAACLAVGLACIVWWAAATFTTRGKGRTELSSREIAIMIQREVDSARLCASAQVLSEQPGGREFAEDILRYVAETYPDTLAARKQ